MWTDGLVFWMNNTTRYKFHSWVAETCLNQTLDKMSKLTRCTSVYNPNRYEKKYKVCSCNLYFPVFSGKYQYFPSFLDIWIFSAFVPTLGRIYTITLIHIYILLYVFLLFTPSTFGTKIWRILLTRQRNLRYTIRVYDPLLFFADLVTGWSGADRMYLWLAKMQERQIVLLLGFDSGSSDCVRVH